MGSITPEQAAAILASLKGSDAEKLRQAVADGRADPLLTGLGTDRETILKLLAQLGAGGHG